MCNMIINVVYRFMFKIFIAFEELLNDSLKNGKEDFILMFGIYMGTIAVNVCIGGKVVILGYSKLGKWEVIIKEQARVGWRLSK